MSVVESYTPNRPQGLFHGSAAKYRLLLGAWGAGKTAALIWEEIALALEYPDSLGVIYRATYPALRDTTKRDFLGMIPPEIVKHEVKSEGREEIQYINGSRTLFRCLDDFRKLGSTQFDRITVDEAWEMDEQSFMTLAYGRLRGKVGPRRMVCATNPPDEDHFLHKFFVEQAAKDTECFHLSTYDNAENLPEGYIAKLEQMPRQWRRKFLEGKWGVLQKGAGVFEADFDEDIHVGDLKPIRGRQVYRAIDPGFRRPACVWMQVDAQGNASILRELLGENEPIRQFLGRVQEITAKEFPGSPVEDYVDIAANQRNDKGPTVCQIMANEFGMNPFSRKMGIERGIEGMRLLLQQRRLKFDRRCKWLVKGCLGGYAMDPKKNEPFKDGLYDNLFDACRYVLVPVMLDARSVFEGKPLPRRLAWWDGDPLAARMH